jgi:hypothetical protein
VRVPARGVHLQRADLEKADRVTPELPRSTLVDQRDPRQPIGVLLFELGQGLALRRL